MVQIRLTRLKADFGTFSALAKIIVFWGGRNWNAGYLCDVLRGRRKASYPLRKDINRVYYDAWRARPDVQRQLARILAWAEGGR